MWGEIPETLTSRPECSVLLVGNGLMHTVGTPEVWTIVLP